MGVGTAIHEMVHAYMGASFPDAPSWFDEGLASLYEESEIREEEVHGLVNWRFPPLQQALEAETVPRLRDVMSASRKRSYRKPNRLLGIGQPFALGRQFPEEARLRGSPQRTDQTLRGRSTPCSGSVPPIRAYPARPGIPASPRRRASLATASSASRG